MAPRKLNWRKSLIASELGVSGLCGFGVFICQVPPAAFGGENPSPDQSCEQESHCATILSWMTHRIYRLKYSLEQLCKCVASARELWFSAVLTNFHDETWFISEKV